MFLTNAHAQTIICTQLFAGRLTNQNWKNNKVNDNNNYYYSISTWLICVSYLNIFRFLWYVFPNNNFSFTVNQDINQFLNLHKTSVTKEKQKELAGSKSN